MNKKVSIILPIYNVEKYLPQCLDSIVIQSFQNWEALLIDDGSTDSSGAICNHYAEADTRFRVVHQKNAGAANAKNVGLDLARGDYVAFVDSDDYVEPNWLESLMVVAEQCRSDVVEYCFDKVYRNARKNVHFSSKSPWEFTAVEYLQQYLSNWQCSLFWNKMFRRELVQSVRFRKEKHCIDDEFFTYKVVSKAERIDRIDEVLYHYRQRRSSTVQNPAHQLQVTLDALEILIERYEWVCAQFPALRKIYLTHDIDILFYISKFPHNKETAAQFRKVKQYYLKEVLLRSLDVKLLVNVIKLQGISSKRLLSNPTRPAKSSECVEVYFE